MADKFPLPLRSRMFYIDEVDIPKVKLRRLERSLNLLGAKIEKFFTKEIYCLVTDHAQHTDYKTKTPSRSATGDGTSTSTPSPFAYTPGSNLGTPPDTTTSCKPTKPLSRASMMLSRSHQNSSRHGSLSTVSASEQLVRNARQWSIKMISTDDALQWLEKKVVALGLHKNRNSSMERTERAPRNKAKVLKAPFVKIEDESGKYRPIYRQLSAEETPSLNLHAIHCPFETRGGPLDVVDESSQGGVEKAEPAHSGEAHQSTQPDRSKIGNGKLLNKDKKLPVAKPKNMAGTKGKTTPNNQRHVKKKLAFCMTCKVRYEDLDQHLRSDQHKQFADNDANYAAVDQLINTNASMHRFLEDIMKYHKVHQQEGLAAATTADDDDSGKHGLVENEVTVCTTALPSTAITELLVHRSVSDGSGSTHSGAQTTEEEEHPPSLQPKEKQELLQVAPKPSLQHLQQEPIEPQEERVLPGPASVENCENEMVLGNEQIIPIIDSKPNISRIDIKPKVASRLSSSPIKVLRLPLERTSVITGTDALEKLPDDTSQSLERGMAKESYNGLDMDTLSPSEIVKIRKRGKKGANNTKVRSSSPVKGSKQKTSPKKKAPSKSPIKTNNCKLKADSLADMQAHWKLLSDRQTDTSDGMYGLPMDVSYGVLTDNQLENIAQQQTSAGMLDDDDRSLVQSIHSFLANTNFNNNNAQNDNTNEGDNDNALLSCDSYISQKLSSQLSQSSNSMMQPTTPRKSPRVSLGARDYPDEHFSPQKQRLSESMQKEERLSSECRQARRGRRVPRLILDEPVREIITSPTPIENKENRLGTPESVSITSATLSNRGETADDDIRVLPIINESVFENMSTESSPREALPKANNSEIFTDAKPLHASTPALPVADTATKSFERLVNAATQPTPSIKKSLFETRTKQLKERPSKPDIPPSEVVCNRKKSTPKARVKPRRRSSSIRKQTVYFRQHSSISELSTCFGFEEDPANMSIEDITTHPNTQKNQITPVNRSKARQSMKKVEYDRQTSLLSFGSASASLCDDVFSQPPDVLSPVTMSRDANNFPILDSIADSNSQTEPAQSPRTGRPLRSSYSRPSDGAEYATLSDTDLASPGFKVSFRIRRKVDDARRILNAGATPRHARENLIINKSNKHSSEAGTNSGIRNGGDSKRSHTSPTSTPSKRKRKVGNQGELVTLPAEPTNPPHTRISAMDAAPDFMTRKPRVARERELRQISERDISTCSPLTSDDETEVDTREHEDHSSIYSQPPTRTLTKTARDFIRKNKYDYEVNSAGRSSSECLEQLRRTRRQAQLASS